MNREEIEEIETLEIDFKDTDELELALEVSSKKAIYLINDLIKHLFELQQENQSLKKENKILRENAEHNDKVVEKINWENQELKKQLEEKNKPQIFIDTQDIEERYAEGLYQDYLEEENKKLKEQVDYLRRSIERKEEIISDAQNEIIPYTHEYVTKLINRQNNFIEYLNSYIKLLSDDPDYIEERQKEILEEVLLKYKEIIG